MGRLSWQAAEVVRVVGETPRARTLVFSLTDWGGHRAGQHLDVRLTAEDGYQAARSYSIASPPQEPEVAITVERLADGEVSPYLVDEVVPGDRLEVRGPIGGYFVWEPAMGGPLQLVAGGSGVVPLMAMLRTRVAAGSEVPIRLLYSARTPADVIYRADLLRLAALPGIEVTYTYTRVAPPGWAGYQRRIDTALLREATWSPEEKPLIYICGSSGIVEVAGATLLALGHPPTAIRTERFGPTAG